MFRPGPILFSFKNTDPDPDSIYFFTTLSSTLILVLLFTGLPTILCVKDQRQGIRRLAIYPKIDPPNTGHFTVSWPFFYSGSTHFKMKIKKVLI